MHLSLRRLGPPKTSHVTSTSLIAGCQQEEKATKVLARYASAVREIDINLSVSKGKGDDRQKCEFTVFLKRLGVVSPNLHSRTFCQELAYNLAVKQEPAKLAICKQACLPQAAW